MVVSFPTMPVPAALTGQNMPIASHLQKSNKFCRATSFVANLYVILHPLFHIHIHELIKWE